MTPRRRTTILASLTLGTVLFLVPATYLGWQATIGVRAPDSLCTSGSLRGAMPKGSIGYSTTQKWRWWKPRYVVTCVYYMKNGSTLRRPPPK